jgi:predicted DCC family thiol-disulfide oxidoreductase YuxK
MDNTDLMSLIEHKQIILFDAECKLCNRWTRFILRFDTAHHFTLCSVQSPPGQALLVHFGFPLSDYETMLLISRGRLFTHSDAFLAIMRQLPLPWRLCGMLRIFPARLRNWLYLLIARNRYKLFGRYSYCALPSAENARRFL